jgi:hypothetical protein
MGRLRSQFPIPIWDDKDPMAVQFEYPFWSDKPYLAQPEIIETPWSGPGHEQIQKGEAI